MQSVFVLFGILPRQLLWDVTLAGPRGRPRGHLLRSRGLNQSQVAECVRKKPKLLLLDARVLSPKLEVLDGIGFSGTGLGELLPRYPSILDLSVNHRMVSSVAFPRTVVSKEADFVRVLSIGSLAKTPSTRLRLMLKLC